MPDSYARALLATDVTKESFRKEAQLRKAQRAREKQESKKGIARFLGKAIGTIFFGPAGMFLGDVAGGVADLLDESEKLKIKQGKFGMSQVEELNRQLREYDRLSNIAGAVGVGRTALDVFTLGGGMTEIREGGGAIDTLLNADYWTKFGGPGGRGGLYDYFRNRATGIDAPLESIMYGSPRLRGLSQ